MKILIYNFGYFLSEAKRTIRFNWFSNLISVIGTGLILFLFGLVLTGWAMGDKIISLLQDEAEISVYFDDSMDITKVDELIKTVKGMEGVKDAHYIDETKARTQMEEMLGEEAEILTLFEVNPFEAFLEVRIDLERMDQVIIDVKSLEGIEYVRDNRAVLEQLKGIMDGLKLIGSLVIMAVAITTFIMISHMIRQGIYQNREQINTLRLLGAPDSFIGFPFILTGTLLTAIGGSCALFALIFILNTGYYKIKDMIPFLPLPGIRPLKDTLIWTITTVSLGLGLSGSLFGLLSIRERNNN